MEGTNYTDNKWENDHRQNTDTQTSQQPGYKLKYKLRVRGLTVCSGVFYVLYYHYEYEIISNITKQCSLDKPSVRLIAIADFILNNELLRNEQLQILQSFPNLVLVLAMSKFLSVFSF